MPIYCTALGCKNTNDIKRKTAAQMELEKTVKVTFHVFPSDPNRRREWIKIMKLENKTLCKRSFLCSLHFEEKCIDRTSLTCVRLRENAIPYLPAEYTFCDNVNSENETVLAPIDPLNVKLEEMEDDPECISVIHSTCDRETNTSPLLILSQEIRRPTRDKQTSISPERIRNCPIVQIIEKKTHTDIERLRKKIKVLQQKLKRKEKKIEIMKTIFDELKAVNLVTHDVKSTM